MVLRFKVICNSIHIVRTTFSLAKFRNCFIRRFSRPSLHFCTMRVKTMVQPKVFTDIIKSAEDSRSYKGLQLENGMKVLLVSDPTTDKSAAALDVNIGYMCDPFELPGLAHFCEHMLFLGTEKYPAENEYSKFLNQHCGSSNAFTAADHTNYYFDVSPTFLTEALDRFAQFFICPLFTESATFREMNAVNSEHEKNLQNDMWRLNQLQKSTANPAHDYSKFGTGNLDTLDLTPKSEGINTREELLKFHSEYYSSNIMGLAIVGKETLDELTDMVVSLFSGVQDKNVSVPEWNEHPFDSEHLKLQGYIVPVKDIRSLNVTFPIPDLHPHYRSNPGHYLGHLIGHEGPGSLLSELKARGWADNLIGGYKGGAKGFAFFLLNVELTEEGIDHTDDIVTLLFQYLNMLKMVEPQQWVFEECKNFSAMQFRFKDRERPQSYACTLASSIHHFPFEEVLCGPYLLHEYRPDLILELMAKLTPQNLRIAVIGKKFAAEVDQVEQWYGTEYKLEVISDDVLKKWSNAGVNENFKLPPPNEFIPTNFQLVEREPAFHKVPVLIKNTEMSHLWFKQDDDFKLPKAVLSFELESPLAYIDPHHYNSLHLFVELFKDSVTEYAYAAELADLTYNLNQTKFGIFLYVKGYNDKHDIFLKKIMEKLTSFQVDRKRFEILKETYIRTLKNFNAEQPHQHAIYYTSLLLSERVWSNEELLEFANELTIEQVQQFIPHFLSRVHIEALIHGNYTKEQALSLLSIVEDKLKCNMNSNPLLPSQMLRYREHQLCDGCHYVYEVTNDVHRCSAIEAYYQCGVHETRLNMLLEIFGQVITEPCYNVLRVQEQLGYIVFSGARRSHGVQGVRIIIQSDKPPSYVDSRIEAFLQSVDKHLQDMPEKEFESHKLALATRRLEKPKKLDNQTAKYWTEIISHEYNFDRDNIEVICLRTITKEELYSFFKELISFDAPKRKKLSVHVISSVLEDNEESSEEIFLCDANDALPREIDGLIPPPPAFRPPLKVENITEFKSGLGLYPLAKPWINIPPPIIHHTSKSKL